MAFRWIGKSEDGSSVVIHRLHERLFKMAPYFNADWESQNADSIRIGAAVDVETTGLRQDEDQVIEIGLRVFKFNRKTGEVLQLIDSYSAFQDPGHPLSDEIKDLTGISDDDVRGQKIDWEQVNSLLSKCHLIVAHNASFDRPFIDRAASVSQDKIWACSLKQVDWNLKGFTSKKLDSLSIYHGFFTDSHRALNDAEALIHLLSFSDSTSNTPYLLELLSNARKLTVEIAANFSPFETKDALKSRGYGWDGPNKYWSKIIPKDELDAEVKWLTDAVYRGNYKGTHREIAIQDQFKA
jgi:DNA polymerase-3 subunit epsilon